MAARCLRLTAVAPTTYASLAVTSRLERFTPHPRSRGTDGLRTARGVCAGWRFAQSCWTRSGTACKLSANADLVWLPHQAPTLVVAEAGEQPMEPARRSNRNGKIDELAGRAVRGDGRNWKARDAHVSRLPLLVRRSIYVHSGGARRDGAEVPMTKLHLHLVAGENSVRQKSNIRDSIAGVEIRCVGRRIVIQGGRLAAAIRGHIGKVQPTTCAFG